MSDRHLSRIRTALPQAWAAVLLYVLDRCNITPDDLATDAIVYAAIPAAGALVYDLGRTLEAHGLTGLSRLLLGSTRQPVYTPPQF